jgi:hypothetical protein
MLRRDIGLPISIEHNFKFLVLLPLEANEKIEALKQYYGITHEGHLIVRGVEMLSALFDCENLEEIVNRLWLCLSAKHANDKLVPFLLN